MFKRLLLLVCSTISFPVAQELLLSVNANTYQAGQDIPVNISVLNADAMPGAYKMDIGYGKKLTYVKSTSAEKGPFSITPVAVVNSNTVTVAGFQGITDNRYDTVPLVMLIFTPSSDSVSIDTSTFTVKNREIFSAQAAIMDLRMAKQSVSVTSGKKTVFRQSLSITQNHLRFSVPRNGRLSVCIYDISGRTVAVPVRGRQYKAGNYTVPIGKALKSGIYVVTLRGVGLNATKKLEVVR
ncbi:MAG: T9SS type A sorting domain-containing protein [Fibrobacter sp.]|nr:T9SS type A sorting domain-containing protein [Fibrobacter sp.]